MEGIWVLLNFLRPWASASNVVFLRASLALLLSLLFSGFLDERLLENVRFHLGNCKHFIAVFEVVELPNVMVLDQCFSLLVFIQDLIFFLIVVLWPHL